MQSFTSNMGLKLKPGIANKGLSSAGAINWKYVGMGKLLLNCEAILQVGRHMHT